MTKPTTRPTCPYCWGTHGCDRRVGHDGDHQCLDLDGNRQVCSTRPRGAPDVFHFATDEPEHIN